MRTGNFLVSGHDFEGENREWWTATFDEALKSAREMTDPNSPHPAWLNWEVWGNHAVTAQWQVLSCSSRKKAKHNATP